MSMTNSLSGVRSPLPLRRDMLFGVLRAIIWPGLDDFAINDNRRFPGRGAPANQIAA